MEGFPANPSRLLCVFLLPLHPQRLLLPQVADDQQARHLDLVTAREERKFTLHANKPGTLTYSWIIRRREGSIWPGEMIDHCTRNRMGLPASQHVLKERLKDLNRRREKANSALPMTSKPDM